MRTIYFYNPGQLDIRGATIMGLSAKDDEQAIGRFGTGLKYAIASILRWNGAIEIETGGKKYEFRKQPIDFRGKAHDQIIMLCDGHEQQLGFTTHYGSHWEPWQIFRELYSNALDENGGVSFDREPYDRACHASTLVTVRCAEVADIYAERNTIILPTKGEHAGSGSDLYHFSSPSNYLYYRGVRVAQMRCLHTWNLTDGVKLTEDRSIVDSWPYTVAIRDLVQASTDRDFIRRMVTAQPPYFEAELCFNKYCETSDDFLDICEEVYRRSPKLLNESAKAVLLKKREKVSEPALVELSKMQQFQLDKARRLLRMTDLNPDAYPVEVRALHKNTLGQAKNNTVILSPQLFEQGTKQVVSTWYEELLHLETGLVDCTYEMQSRLFNLLISLYEEHVFGEPC